MTSVASNTETNECISISFFFLSTSRFFSNGTQRTATKGDKNKHTQNAFKKVELNFWHAVCERSRSNGQSSAHMPPNRHEHAAVGFHFRYI